MVDKLNIELPISDDWEYIEVRVTLQNNYGDLMVLSGNKEDGVIHTSYSDSYEKQSEGSITVPVEEFYLTRRIIDSILSFLWLRTTQSGIIIEEVEKDG